MMNCFFLISTLFILTFFEFQLLSFVYSNLIFLLFEYFDSKLISIRKYRIIIIIQNIIIQSIIIQNMIKQNIIITNIIIKNVYLYKI